MTVAALAVAALSVLAFAAYTVHRLDAAAARWHDFAQTQSAVHHAELQDVLQRVQAPDLATITHAAKAAGPVDVVDGDRAADDEWLDSPDSLIEIDEDLALLGGTD